MQLLPRLIAYAAAATTVACASVASAATAPPGLAFVPPTGWIVGPHIGDQPAAARAYYKPANTSESVILGFPEHAPPMPHPADEHWSAIAICGNHPASYVVSEKHRGTETVIVDAVLTSWNGVRVYAMYTRPGGPASPEAERSIRSLCVRPRA